MAITLFMSCAESMACAEGKPDAEAVLTIRGTTLGLLGNRGGPGRDQRAPLEHVGGAQPQELGSIVAWLESGVASPEEAAQPCKKPLGAVDPSPDTGPPAARDEAPLAGQLELNLEAPPGEALAALRRFLSEAAPAELEAEEEALGAHRLRAAVFEDFVQVRLEAHIRRREEAEHGSGSGGSLVVLKPLLRADVAHFDRICSQMKLFFESCGLAFTSCEELPTTPMDPLLTKDSLDEPSNLYGSECSDQGSNLSENPDAWYQRLWPLLAEATSEGREESRAEAARALARLAAYSTACHLPLARAAVACEGFLGSVVRTLKAAPASSVAWAYPLAAALRLAAGSKRAAAFLADSPLAGLGAGGGPQQGASQLVQRELLEAMKALHAVSSEDS